MDAVETPSGLIAPRSAVEAVQRNSPREQMLRQQEGLAKLEHEFPQILDLAFALGARLTAYANMHKIQPKEIQFAKVLWHNDGTITFKVTHKGRALAPADVHLT